MYGYPSFFFDTLKSGIKCRRLGSRLRGLFGVLGRRQEGRRSDGRPNGAMSGNKWGTIGTTRHAVHFHFQTALNPAEVAEGSAWIAYLSVSTKPFS